LHKIIILDLVHRQSFGSWFYFCLQMKRIWKKIYSIESLSTATFKPWYCHVLQFSERWNSIIQISMGWTIWNLHHCQNLKFYLTLSQNIWIKWNRYRWNGEMGWNQNTYKMERQTKHDEYKRKLQDGSWKNLYISAVSLILSYI
jgi:hypothetical protein